MGMKKDIYPVKLTILITAISSSLLLFSSFNQTAYAGSSPFLNYENPDYNIKMQYPANWEVVETDLSLDEVVEFRINSASVHVFVTPTCMEFFHFPK